MTPEENEKTPEPQKTRQRSPNYPSVSLRTAIEKIIPWFKADGIVASPKDALVKHMGYEKSTGDAGRLLSALKGFGLLAEVDGRFKLTPRGVDIVAREPADPKRQLALKDAAMGPQVYRDLLKEYSAGLPSDTTLSSELIAGKGFNHKYVKDFLKDFRATLVYAGISPSGVVESNGEHEDPIQEVHIGDYVQWEVQGILQLPEPRRVRAFSEDGEWAFLDGSETGVPKKELSVMDDPVAEQLLEAPLPAVQPPEGQRKPGDLLKQTIKAVSPPKLRSYSWALSGDFYAKLELFGEAQTEEDLDALADYTEITVKALKRSLKKTTSEVAN